MHCRMAAAMEVTSSMLAEGRAPCKPLPDAAISFIRENCDFGSSSVFSAVYEMLQEAYAQGDVVTFFQVPIREKLLSYQKALLWVAFLFTYASNPAAYATSKFGPVNVQALLHDVNLVYDIDVNDLLLIHTLEEEDDDDDDEDEDEDDEDSA